MTVISKNKKVITLINIFAVEPENQQRVVDMLIEATEKVMKKQPGYVSVNIHKSLDGRRVANYAQWRSQKDYDAIFKNPEVIAHMNELLKFTKPDYHIYEVVYTDEARVSM